MIYYRNTPYQYIPSPYPPYTVSPHSSNQRQNIKHTNYQKQNIDYSDYQKQSISQHNYQTKNINTTMNSHLLNVQQSIPKDCPRKESITSKEEKAVFEILGIKLYFDDLLLLCLIFFLYTEGVQDQYLFIVLILLLLS